MAEIEKNTKTVGDEIVEEAVKSAPVAVKAAEKAADNGAKKAAAKAKAKKPSLGSKIKKAWREFKAEFKKIVWSSKKDTFNNTVLVITSIIVVAVCIGALDLLFSNLLSALGKIA